MFFVRGIVDNIKDTTNNKVIQTRVQKVILDNSNSPNDTVSYKFNFKSIIIFLYDFSNYSLIYNCCHSTFKIYTYFFFPSEVIL